MSTALRSTSFRTLAPQEGIECNRLIQAIIEMCMAYKDKYLIEIYLMGAVFDMPLHGPIEYLQAKIFLDTLLQRKRHIENLPLPIPEPGQDFYDLTEKQLS